MVEQCGATVEQCWRKSGTVIVKQWNNDGGTVWCYNGTVLVEHWNSDGGKVWWYSITVMVEQCGGTVEHC